MREYICKPGLVCIAGGVACVSAYYGWKYLSSSPEDENVYETTKSVDEYMLMHFGTEDLLMPWDFSPKSALEFPKRCIDLCFEFIPKDNEKLMRALDVGCAVGRSTFELTKRFHEVIGIDFSHAFIAAANDMKENGRRTFSALEEGAVYSKHEAFVDSNLDRSRAHFEQGDACNLRPDLGQFDCVFAGNLICRLPEPLAFLKRLESLVAPGGFAVITSPYTFLEHFTNKSKWLGGYTDANGQNVRGFDTLKRVLSDSFELIESRDMPFVIRETARKNQWTVSHATVWRKK